MKNDNQTLCKCGKIHSSHFSESKGWMSDKDNEDN
jgi:hypothetical protein